MKGKNTEISYNTKSHDLLSESGKILHIPTQKENRNHQPIRPKTKVSILNILKIMHTISMQEVSSQETLSSEEIETRVMQKLEEMGYSIFELQHAKTLLRNYMNQESLISDGLSKIKYYRNDGDDRYILQKLLQTNRTNISPQQSITECEDWTILNPENKAEKEGFKEQHPQMEALIKKKLLPIEINTLPGLEETRKKLLKKLSSIAIQHLQKRDLIETIEDIHKRVQLIIRPNAQGVILNNIHNKNQYFLRMHFSVECTIFSTRQEIENTFIIPMQGNIQWDRIDDTELGFAEDVFQYDKSTSHTFAVQQPTILLT